MTVGRVIWLIIKFICYAALVVVLAGVTGMFVPPLLDLCSQSFGGTLKCSAPIYRIIFEFGFTVVLLTVFTGIPGLLALAGLFFLIRDVFWPRRT